MKREHVIAAVAVLMVVESLLFGALLHDERPEMPILLIAVIAPIRAMLIYAGGWLLGWLQWTSVISSRS